MHNLSFLLVLAIFANPYIVNGQKTQNVYKEVVENVATKATSPIDDGRTHLNWEPLTKDQFSDEITMYSLYFKGATYSDNSNQLPIYTQRVGVSSGNSK